MFRYNHNSRCAECTRFSVIMEEIEFNQQRTEFPPSPIPTVLLCRDCWYNEDVM